MYQSQHLVLVSAEDEWSPWPHQLLSTLLHLIPQAELAFGMARDLLQRLHREEE